MGHPIVFIEQPGRVTIHLSVREPIELGRDCDGIVLTDDRVSRRHLRLEPATDGVLATDLESTNGTFLDDKRVHGSVLLRQGARLLIGSTTVRVEIGNDDGRDPPMRSARTVMTDQGHTSIDVVLASMDDGVPLPPVDDDLGTITIVFSDIESSSVQAVALGDDAWMAVLDHHNSLITTTVKHYGGSVIKNQGDGFMLTFPSARRAIQAMIWVQQQLLDATETAADTGAVRVRVGIHTGEVIDQDGDIFGKHVIYAARVANLAEGGEILVSAVVQEIAGARGDISFGPGRQVDLKGIGDDQTVFAVEWSDEPADP